MISPAQLTAEELAAVKEYQSLLDLRATQAALGAARYELERAARDLETKAKEIRELLDGRASYPK